MGVIPNKLEAGKDHLSDGDIWADSEEEFTPNVPDDEFYGAKPDASESTEIAALRRIHAKKGYLDGISISKEDSLQQGFDQGYPLGAQIGIEVGKIIGKLQYLSTMAGVDQEIRSQAITYLEEAKNELLIQKVLHRRYFDDDLNLPNSQHTLIQKWKSQVEQLTSGVELQ